MKSLEKYVLFAAINNIEKFSHSFSQNLTMICAMFGKHALVMLDNMSP